MIRELSYVTKLIEAKVNREKHDLEKNILFLLLKGTLSVIILTFLAISLFFWVSSFIERTEVASLMTALIFMIAYIAISLIQTGMKRSSACEHKGTDEWMQIILLLITAFFEGFMAGGKDKRSSGTEEVK